MSSIPLHPEKGLNPFLTYCPRCKWEASELILVGSNDGVYECSCFSSEGSPHLIVGRPKDGICPKSGHRSTFTLKRRLEEGERLPASQPCDPCLKEIEEHRKVVEAGGIYWSCVDCKAKGAIRATAPISGHVRESLKVSAPEPCGVSFTKNECPACGPNAAAHKAGATG